MKMLPVIAALKQRGIFCIPRCFFSCAFALGPVTSGNAAAKSKRRTLLSIRVCYDGWISGNCRLEPLGLLSLDQLLPRADALRAGDSRAPGEQALRIAKMVAARQAFEVIELFKKSFLVGP